MSKPRWIDAGIFRTLRTATRKRSLAVVVGPGFGTATFRRRADIPEGTDRDALADDPGAKSEPDPALTTLFTLRQPGIITTSIADELLASAPQGHDWTAPRVYGPNSKGLMGAWDRKDPFIVRLGGAAAAPDTLVLTGKERKALLKADSRYQAFLRATFSRTVLFVGFDLADPDLIELLDDVARCFNGHVPPNIGLVPAASTDPAAALRANMHYGMTIVEFPRDLGAGKALTELASLLEELEVPKPATGNPPRGFTELTGEFRGSIDADPDALARFDSGDSSSWAAIPAGCDGSRAVASGLSEFVLGDVPDGKVGVALLRAAEGEGKTTLVRRVAWNLAEAGHRIFWREAGVDLPDRYVPAEADDARAVFICDDAEELTHLPQLLRTLAQSGGGKARFLLAADSHRWDRSGLDHRIRRDTVVHDAQLEGVDGGEAEALAQGLSARGVLAAGRTQDDAVAALTGGSGVLLDRINQARTGSTIVDHIRERVAELRAKPDAERLLRAYLATALVHRHGMALGRAHLAALLGLASEAELQTQLVAPLAGVLVPSGTSALRTPHPVVARAVVEVLGSDETTRDELAVELLKTLPRGSVDHPTVFHAPSELIRARRQEPLAPLMLGRLFEAGEDAARNDVLFWFDRGRYESDFSRWEAALAAFDQALWRSADDLREKEHNATVHANRARCLQALGRKQEALAAVDDGLRVAPRDSALERLAEKLGRRRRPPRGGGDRRGGDRGGRGRGAGRGGQGGGGGPGGGGSRRPRVSGGKPGAGAGPRS